MLSHVWAWLHRTLGGRCTALTPLSLCLLINVLKQDSHREDFHRFSACGSRALDCRSYQHTSQCFKKELRFEMSDASGPQRIEVLESNVGEMKVELSPTKAQIEHMIGMMQQLLQAKSADGDQHKDESGGTSRGEAIFVPSPLKTRTNLRHPLPPRSLNHSTMVVF